MKNLESLHTQNQNAEQSLESEDQKAEKILEQETSINRGLLRKIADSPVLRKAFYTIALSVGLLIGKESQAQEWLDGNMSEEGLIENISPLKQEVDINNVMNEVMEYVHTHEQFSQYPHSMMSWAAAIERPTHYQAEQIIELHDTITESAQTEEFKTTTELISFINAKLDPNFTRNASYIQLKDAFPEERGKEAQGHFDCDSRSIMIYSVLQNMGYTHEDVTMVQMEGHMIMYIQDENIFFETTTNKVTELSREEKAQLNPISTPEKYFAHLLANEGTALAFEAKSDFFRGRIDAEKQNQAIQKMKESLALDPDDITNQINLIQLLAYAEKTEENLNMASKLYRDMLTRLVNNYHGISQNNDHENIMPYINKVDEFKYQKKNPSMQELSLHAIKESDYIKNKFTDYSHFLDYETQNHKESALVHTLLLQSIPQEEQESMSADLHRANIAHAQFRAGNYEEYLSHANNLIEKLSSRKKTTYTYYLELEIEKLNNQKMVAEILSGKIDLSEKNIGNIIDEYTDDPILGPVISGEEHWKVNSIDAVEVLKSWKGYKELRELIIKEQILKISR